jgi:hypothetical protein
LQPLVSQSVGSAVFSDSIVASNATPRIFWPLRAAAATPVTAVPWPSVSTRPRLAAMSPLAGSTRPANSGSAGLMPLSTIAILTPRPVPPAS